MEEVYDSKDSKDSEYSNYESQDTPPKSTPEVSEPLPLSAISQEVTTEMPSEVKEIDLELEQLIKKQTAKIKVVGIRPGEKLHEILLTEEEARHTKEFDGYFIIEPQYSFWSEDNFKDGSHLSEGFEYTSNKNPKWITKEEMKEILKKMD